MTKLWGPLGWMTLHSISLLYPVSPTANDVKQTERFLNLFAETITCQYCKTHFASMYAIYKLRHPDFLSSRQKFAMFIFRAHNTVNKRLDKPIQQTVGECMATLMHNIQNTSFAEFRNNYITYLQRNWSKERTGDGMIFGGGAREMKRINDEFWSKKETLEDIELDEDNVLEFIEDTGVRYNSITTRLVSTNVGFRGGKLMLKRF